MENLVNYVFYGIFVIFLVFSSILLAGFVRISFFDWSPPQIFIVYFGTVIGESIAMLILYVKNVAGLRTGIRTAHTYDEEEKINKYMLKLISLGSSLDIVSGTLSWVNKNPAIKKKMIARAKNNELDIYLPEKNNIAKELADNQARIHIIPSLAKQQFARFTLVDKDHPGSAMLAVGCGIIPTFTISEFDERSNSQVVALARDYIEKLREE